MLELCCAYCLYKNIHKQHKILEISDEESLIKENITLDFSKNELNDNIIKLKDLKNKIENEINIINNSYDKAINDLTKSFQIKHEHLLKKENEIKEKLQIEVTKAKEKLENNLSQTNNEIRLNEKLNQGMSKFKNDEKNLFKNLNYISKINKNQKSTNQLLQKQMTNIRFNYKEEENEIIYEEYNFYGIKIPENIKFKNISQNKSQIKKDELAKNMQKNQLQKNEGEDIYPEKKENKYHDVQKMNSLTVLEKEKELCDIIIEYKKNRGEDYDTWEFKQHNIDDKILLITSNVQEGLWDFPAYQKKIKEQYQWEKKLLLFVEKDPTVNAKQKEIIKRRVNNRIKYIEEELKN